MSDCAAAMLLPAAVYAAGDLLGGILTVYTAGILGSFADAVLRMNVDGGMRSFLQMLVCLAVNIVVVPLIGVFGEVLMFTRSLKHERYCVGSFLDKTYRSVSEMGAGEVQYSIDDDPIDMRCNFVDLAENVVIIPVIFAYLVYRSVGISPLFTVITAAVSALKLTVPVVTRKAMAKFDRADKEYQAELREYETEMTERPHIVRLYGLKKAIIERFDRLYLGYFRRAVRRSSRYRTIAGSILSAAARCAP